MNAVSAQAESCWVRFKLPKIVQHMHVIIPYMFDCWPNPVAHLLLLKSSMTYLTVYFTFILPLICFRIDETRAAAAAAAPKRNNLNALDVEDDD